MTAAPPDIDLVDKARIGSFTDNVVSIAITLLVLDVRLPADFSNLTVPGIARAVWPRLLGFVLSFAIIGVYWVGHHFMFRVISGVPRSVLWANNLFLLFVSLIPASAALLGSHPEHAATAVIYGLNVICVGLSMLLMWSVIVRFHRSQNLPLPDEIVRTAYWRTARGIGFSAVGIAVAGISPWLSYAIFWISPVSYIVLQMMPLPKPKSASSKSPDVTV